MKGGTVIVCGPTNDVNGPLDSGDNNNTITVTGGTLIAVGSTGMMEVPESNYIAATNLNAAAGTLIVVTDDADNVLAALKTPKQAQALYESISKQLESNKTTIDESKETEKTVVTESKAPVYKSQDLLDTIDLMNRVLNC